MKKYFILTIALMISLLMTSCATYHRLDGIEDYADIVLENGDIVRIVLDDKSVKSFRVDKTDDKNIYAKYSTIVVNKKEIKSIDLKRGNGWLDYVKISIALTIGSMLSAP